MSPEVQAISRRKIEEIRAAGRIPQLLDYAIARRDAEAEAIAGRRDPYGFRAILASAPEAANDDAELDALLDSLNDAIPADDAPATPEPTTSSPTTPLDWLDAGPEHESPLLAGNPKKRPAKARTSYARDWRNLRRHNGFVPDVRTPSRCSSPVPSVAGTTPSPHTPSSPSHTNDNTPSQTTKKRRNADANDTRKAPAWARTTDVIRGHAYMRTVSATGAGLSFTLNLGPKISQAANDNPAAFKPMIHDRLVKALKTVFGEGREFVFGIEATRDGRWHLHGAVDATADEREKAEEALRRAGGAWGSSHHRDRQAHARTPVWSPDGWARYVLKAMAATKRRLRVKSVLSVTRGCRQRAEDFWEATRRKGALVSQH